MDTAKGGALKEIKGLHYRPDFLTREEQARIAARIDASDWRKDLKRRVQHYGYLYDYKARKIEPRHYLGELPDFLEQVAERIFSQTELFSGKPVQAIVNEYVGNQGISWHYDALTFGPEIATISLLEPWAMEFHRRYERDRINGEQNALLETGSCLIMTGESRYKWFHSIPRLSQEKSGLKRGRRISLTFRTLAQK